MILLGQLEDDLEYSSDEEDDWDEVEDSTNQGFSVTVDPNATGRSQKCNLCKVSCDPPCKDENVRFAMVPLKS